MSLYYFNPIPLTKNTSYAEVNDWKSIYKFISLGVGLNDRTYQFKQPVNSKIYHKYQLPQLSTTNMSYKDCCDKRAKELWDLSIRLQKPLGIMWSGGIDSTRVLVSFLENFPLAEIKDRIKVVTSYDAKIENQEFFRTYIAGKLDIVNVHTLPWMFDRSIILVSGELNDQLFGSDLLRNFMLENASCFTAKFSKDIIIQYVNQRIQNMRVTSLLVDAVVNSATTYGITLDKNADWFWWWNFCFKWHAVCFRSLLVCAPNLWSNLDEDFINNYQHNFFCTDDFQLWSINNSSSRNITKWSDYKYQAKLDIFQFDKNQEYFETKLKKGSLRTVFVQRAVLEGIDSNFKVIEKLNLEDHYNSDNDFKL